MPGLKSIELWFKNEDSSQYSFKHFFEGKSDAGAGEMAGQLGSLVAPGEDLNPSPSTHMKLSTVCNSSPRGFNTFF